VVENAVVASPMIIMLTAKVESRLERGGAFMTRWTAMTYMMSPATRPATATRMIARYGLRPTVWKRR